MSTPTFHMERKIFGAPVLAEQVEFKTLALGQALLTEAEERHGSCFPRTIVCCRTEIPIVFDANYNVRLGPYNILFEHVPLYHCEQCEQDHLPPPIHDAILASINVALTMELSEPPVSEGHPRVTGQTRTGSVSRSRRNRE